MVSSGIKDLKKQLSVEYKINNIDEEYPYTTEFFKLLALCNTVVCEHDKKTQ
jgi:hypothetical protein